ncbi:hypothetical protein BH23PLA1_BH23PLA1_06260 [soil metagenome]
MQSTRKGTSGRSRLRAHRPALWIALAACGLISSVGCQVEYAGMTLPSGKYMYDDVQYFPPGPEFPWANTLAATQRARMQAQGIQPPPDPRLAPVGVPGAPVPGAFVPGVPGPGGGLPVGQPIPAPGMGAPMAPDMVPPPGF